MINRRTFISCTVATAVTISFGIKFSEWRRLSEELPIEGQFCDVKTIAEMWRSRSDNVIWYTGCPYIEPGGFLDPPKGILVVDPTISFWRPSKRIPTGLTIRAPDVIRTKDVTWYKF